MVEEIVIFESNKVKKLKKKSAKVNKTSFDTKNLSNGIVDLVSEYLSYREEIKAAERKPKIKVGEVFSSVAYVYERLRNMVDYKGEHLLGKNAIYRFLQRKYALTNFESSEKIASSIIKELIWARYLGNEEVPATKIRIVASIIEEYHQTILSLPNIFVFGSNEYNLWKERILETEASEIEEALFPEVKFQDSLSHAMFAWFMETYQWNQNLSDEEKQTYIYIAVHKSLLKSDNARVMYHLMKKVSPNWGKRTFTPDDKKLYVEAYEKLTSPLQMALYPYIQKRTAPFQILKDVFDNKKEDIVSIINEPEILEKEVRESSEKKYKEISKKINTGIIRSVIYIFITKMIIALAIEIPVEALLAGVISPLPLYINMFFPPLFMFIVGSLVKKPGAKDTDRIVESVKGFVDKRIPEKIHFNINLKTRESIWDKIFLGIYIFTSLMVVGIVVAILRSLDFNLINIAIFFLFMSSVLLFGFRIRYTASELKMTGEREGMLSHLFSILTLPFLNMGVIFSRTISKINFIILIMDFLIEAPLKNLIAVIDEWNSYIRERREEVVEVPQD